jgi:hypothetical protein
MLLRLCLPLTSDVCELQMGYPCLSLHGGKDQSDRESTINDFKSDVCNLLVATSVAARGLDVKDLILVVNYHPPSHHEDYVHRVGRTGMLGCKLPALCCLWDLLCRITAHMCLFAAWMPISVILVCGGIRRAITMYFCAVSLFQLQSVPWALVFPLLTHFITMGSLFQSMLYSS